MILSYTSGPGPFQLGYSVTRQTGSHLRLTTYEQGEHHLTIPPHSPLRLAVLIFLLTQNPELNTQNFFTRLAPTFHIPHFAFHILSPTANSELKTQNSELASFCPSRSL